jgi:hypothetical protein
MLYVVLTRGYSGFILIYENYICKRAESLHYFDRFKDGGTTYLGTSERVIKDLINEDKIIHTNNQQNCFEELERCTKWGALNLKVPSKVLSWALEHWSLN